MISIVNSVILNLFQDPHFKINFSENLHCHNVTHQKSFLSRPNAILNWILKQVQDDKEKSFTSYFVTLNLFQGQDDKEKSRKIKKLTVRGDPELVEGSNHTNTNL